VQRRRSAHSVTRLRSVRLTARLDPQRVREFWGEFVERAGELEDSDLEPLTITLPTPPAGVES
jgi:hypothetical protein